MFAWIKMAYFVYNLKRIKKQKKFGKMLDKNAIVGYY